MPGFISPSLRANLKRSMLECGWCLLPPKALNCVHGLSCVLGEVVEGATRRNILITRTRAESRPGTLSALSGEGRQPFHTDAAHRLVPPRYVVLRHVAGEAQTRTHLLDTHRYLRSVDGVREQMEASLWRVNGGRTAFYSSALVCRGRRLQVRFDPMCMTPMNGDAEAVRSALLDDGGPGQRFGESVLIDVGCTLVIDNVRVLHARGVACRDDDRSHRRVIARYYFAGRHR